MTQRLLSFILLLIFHVCSLEASEKFCGASEFDEISLNCIKDNIQKEKVRIPFSALKYDHILYFITDTGSLGKMKIHNAVEEKTKCELNFDFHTYKNLNSYSASKTSQIKTRIGVWESSPIHLDQARSKSDLQLTRKKNKCYLETDRGYLYVAGKLETQEMKSFGLIYYTALLLIGFACFSLTKLMFDDENQYRSSEVIDGNKEMGVDELKSSPILKYSIPFFRRYITPAVNSMKSKKDIVSKYKKILASAGVNRYLTEVDFFSFKLFSILTFPVIFMVLRSLFDAQWSLYFVPLFGIVGYKYPDIWANSRADARKEDVLLNLPFAVDMLALSVEAGLDFVAAMRKVVMRAKPSALRDEFETVIREIQLGSTRAQALKQMAWRVDTLPMTSFCASLIAADSVGASIGPILKSLSGEMRMKRSALIEKRGEGASSKILMPTVVFILPAIFLVVGLAMGLDFIGGGS